MVLCCCGDNNDQLDDPEGEAGGPEDTVVRGLLRSEVLSFFLYSFSAERPNSHSVNKMFYSRIGRVEKFKHGSKNFYFVFYSLYLFFGCLP